LLKNQREVPASTAALTLTPQAYDDQCDFKCFTGPLMNRVILKKVILIFVPLHIRKRGLSEAENISF